MKKLLFPEQSLLKKVSEHHEIKIRIATKKERANEAVAVFGMQALIA